MILPPLVFRLGGTITWVAFFYLDGYRMLLTSVCYICPSCDNLHSLTEAYE